MRLKIQKRYIISYQKQTNKTINALEYSADNAVPLGCNIENKFIYDLNKLNNFSIQQL